jgi:hypothetical protein
MRRLLLVAFFALLPAAAPAQDFSPSHRQLLGCFGEAFTLVEHAWRLAPKHLATVMAESANAGTEARQQFLAGLVSSAVEVDQDGALAVARNLSGCIDQGIAGVRPDATTAVLATAVRTEIDSALEDVDAYVREYAAQRQRLLRAVPPVPGAHATAIDSYDTFGERLKSELASIRTRVDALVKAATP